METNCGPGRENSDYFCKAPSGNAGIRTMRLSAALMLMPRSRWSAPLCALLAIQAAACAEREVWTGRRCALGEPECLSGAQAHDATISTSDDAELPPASASDAGSFDACEGCAPLDAGAAPGAARVLCPAGRYEGPVEGEYTPGAAGACGLFTLFSGMGRGLAQFSISEDGSMSAAVGSNACAVGIDFGPDAALSADGALPAGAIQRTGLLVGSVDCTTGKLTAEARSIYRTPSLCTLGLINEDFFAKNTIEATFDPSTGRFEQGVMHVREPPSLLGPAPSGELRFTATRVGPSEPLDAPDADCFLGVPFPDHLFDAGG
jgi:hypothetical protein